MTHSAAAMGHQTHMIISPSITKSMFNSSNLSLALQQPTTDYRHIDVGESLETCLGRRSREDELDSRSGSENVDAGSADEDHDGGDVHRPRKKRYHRHTPQQIQELEAMFKECPHPDEKQRLELSRRLCLETRQVKFWFQNRRTQMKTQLERHENSLLKQENDKLRAENLSIRDAMRNPTCCNCGAPAIMGEISLEEQHLRIENARLKDELDRVCGVAGKFLGRPISSLQASFAPPLMSSGLELPVTCSDFCGLTTVPCTLPLGPDYGCGISSPLPPLGTPSGPANSSIMGLNRSLERSMFLELALTAMDELVKMAETNEPLWINSLKDGRQVLNREEYSRIFTARFSLNHDSFVYEASKDTGLVIINSFAIVDTLMDSNRWAEMFPSIVARCSTIDVISTGMAGTRNGSIHLMQAELQFLSPLVPIREVNFLRFCKQHSDGLWAVADVSIDAIQDPAASPTFVNCRRLPSGCVIQDMPNGYSKVTWVEHAEYDETEIHSLYRSLVSYGHGYGARRWVATMQRQTECLAVLISSTISDDDHTAINASGRRSMLKLAQRMTNSFCTGVSASSLHTWKKLSTGNVDQDVRVMTRKSVDDPGEPPGIVLSAATSVWLPVSSERLFNFLRNERLRFQWDILSNGGPMQEMAHIAKDHDHGNSVSLLRSSAMSASQSSMLILQETCIDDTQSLVVYAPVDVPAMQVVMNGGDSAYVALLPSGFAIVADESRASSCLSSDGQAAGEGGSLLTVAFQILVNSLPTARLTVDSVDTVNNLISCTIEKIKSALLCGR